MKNKGFVLTETLIVSVVVMTTLVLVYVQFTKINNAFTNTYNYNNIDNIYMLHYMTDFLRKDGLDKFPISDLLDVTNCDSTYYKDKNYCKMLYKMFQVQTVILTGDNVGGLLVSLNENDSYNINLFKFVKSIDDSDHSLPRRIIVEFKDGNFGTLPF